MKAGGGRLIICLFAFPRATRLFSFLINNRTGTQVRLRRLLWHRCRPRVSALEAHLRAPAPEDGPIKTVYKLFQLTKPKRIFTRTRSKQRLPFSPYLSWGALGGHHMEIQRKSQKGLFFYHYKVHFTAIKILSLNLIISRNCDLLSVLVKSPSSQ